MAEFPVLTLAPARVHERARALTGHHPAWIRRPYHGGIYSLEHFRVCSWCGCINPSDMIELLRAGDSRLEATAKDGKFLLFTPNPIAGELVRMGSIPIAVFNWEHPPSNLIARLRAEASEREASAAERLVGHIERPLYELAPLMIRQPFYDEHTTDRQWAEIWAAAQQGESNVQSLPGAEAQQRRDLPQRQ